MKSGNADSNETGQNRLEWLEILEMVWSVLRLIFKTSSMTPDLFYVFNPILSFSIGSQSFKKICTWEVFGGERLKCIAEFLETEITVLNMVVNLGRDSIERYWADTLAQVTIREKIG